MLSKAASSVMTTQAVAEKLGVTPRTIQLWSDQGLIPAFKTPGGHRRFRSEDVRALIQRIEDKQKQQSQLESVGDITRVLMVDADRSRLNHYRVESASMGPLYEFRFSDNPFESLLLIGAWKPQVLVSGLHLPSIEHGLGMYEQLKQHGSYAPDLMIVLTDNREHVLTHHHRLPRHALVLGGSTGFEALRERIESNLEERYRR